MTPQEAIKNFEQEIGEFEKLKKIHAVTHEDYEYIEKTRQLAEWLRELKERRTNTGDTISRKAAIDALCSVCGNDCDKSEFVYDVPQDEQVILCPEHYALTSLPSAQPDHTADISKKVSNSYGHENDLISRKAAVELKPEFLNPNVNRETEEQTAIDRAYARGWNSCNTHWIDEISRMPSAQPESARTFVELVVEYPDQELCAYKEYKGKPYYSIKYIENGETYVGYGTYNPKVLSQFLKEYFISSAQPEIIRCKDCKYWQDQEEGIVEVPICARPQNKYEKFPLVMLIDGDGFCSYAERRADETY